MARLKNIFKKDSLSHRLDDIKQGNSKERDRLIQEYIPFIVKTVSDKTNRYIESENSEEYSIGLEAFNQAIDKYDKDKGGFIAFAELVIKSKITDYMRQAKKHKSTIPISQFEEEESYVLEEKLKTEDFSQSYDLKDEIKDFEKKLKAFDISFSDLVQDAPKHRDTRLNALSIAQNIAQDQELREELLRKKTLPGTKIINKMEVSLKMLKRSRKFIIAAVLIYSGDLELLKDYISNLEGGAAN